MAALKMASCSWKAPILTVSVSNSSDKKVEATVTEVDFEVYGSVKDPKNPKQRKDTPALDPGQSYDLKFDAPCDECCDSECEVYIKLDVTNVLGPEIEEIAVFNEKHERVPL